MSSDLYEGTSINAMCQEVRQWGSQIPVGSDRDKRRKKIEPTIRSIVALPERLNTENCIDLVFASHRIAPLVTSTNWAEYLFVFNVASSQLQTSLSNEASVRRWLEYHEGGIDLIPSVILNLLALMRDAHLVLSPASAALAKALSLTMISSLLPVTCIWQSADKIAEVWRTVNGLFPPEGGIIFFVSCMLDDCSASARFVKRGIFQAKSDQEEEYSSNSHLRVALVTLLRQLIIFPAAERYDTSKSMMQLESILWEPHYKSRDSHLVTHVLRLLITAPSSPTTNHVATSLFRKLSAMVSNRDCVGVAPQRDVLKDRWVQAQCCVDNFPMWSPSVVRELFSLSSVVSRSHPELVLELVPRLASALPNEIFQGVIPQFVLQNRREISMLRSFDVDNAFYNCCIGLCIRDAVASEDLVSLALEAFSVLIADECYALRTGTMRNVDISSLHNRLMEIHDFLLQRLPSSANFILLLRAWVRLLQLHLLLASRTPHADALTFSEIFNLIAEVRDFCTVVMLRAPGHLLDEEFSFLRQENAITATSLWRTLGGVVSGPSLLTAISEFISLI